MQAVFKRIATAVTVVTTRLYLDSLWLQGKQTGIISQIKSCQGAHSWLPLNQQGKLHL